MEKYIIPPGCTDDFDEAEGLPPQASKPRDKSAGEIHMSWLNENSHSKPERAIERSAFRELKAEAEKLAEAAILVRDTRRDLLEGFAEDGDLDNKLIDMIKALTRWQRYLEGEGEG